MISALHVFPIFFQVLKTREIREIEFVKFIYKNL